jgi:serine/threonine protein kinase
MGRLLAPNPHDRPSARECHLFPWLSPNVRFSPSTPKRHRILSPDEVSGSRSKTVRAICNLPSSDSDDSFGSSSERSTSPSSISSGSDDERPTIPCTPKKSPKLPSASTLFSDRMDICSIRSGQICTRKQGAATFIRPSSPMNIDTMVPAQEVWAILYPLPGNVVGTSTLFLSRQTTTIGFDTRHDFVLRHIKIADHHANIIPGDRAESGQSGILHVYNKRPVHFKHMSKIYLLNDGEGISSLRARC